MPARKLFPALCFALAGFFAASAATANDIEALVAARVTGISKPGTTQAGPATLEMEPMGANLWIKVYLPQMTEFWASRPVIAISRAVDGKGVNLHDPAHQFEEEFFQRVALAPSSMPVAHLGGLRTVKLKFGASANDLRQVEGTLKLSFPLKPQTASFAAADIGKEQKVHRRVMTLVAFSAKEAAVRFQGDSPLVAVIGYGADGKRVQTGMGPGSAGMPKITFHAPAVRLELVIAESLVERQFPFTLTPASVAAPSR